MGKGKYLGSLRYLKDTGEQIFKQDCPSFGVMGYMWGKARVLKIELS